jgi:hypothetical protein
MKRNFNDIWVLGRRVGLGFSHFGRRDNDDDDDDCASIVVFTKRGVPKKF